MTSTKSATDVLRPYLLVVPDYQRGYAWEEQHVQEFLEDIHLLEPGKDHYTGTIVLLNGNEALVDDESHALLYAEVVDGQQRLTTVCLLLNEIRRALVAAGQDRAAKGLKQQFLITTKDGVPLHKLRIGSDGLPTWTALLQDQPVKPPETLSGRRLLRAAEQIRKHLAGLTAEVAEPVTILTGLRDVVITRLRFTVHALDQHAEVGVIFETLNDRGKPLTELEKVKNYLLFLAARLPAAPQNALAAKINTAWSQIYRLLLEVAMVSPAGEDQFLRAHWLAAVDPLPMRWKGTKSVKKQFPRERYVQQPDLLGTEIGAYVDSLARAAQAYADCLRPDTQAFSDFGTTAMQVRALQQDLIRAGTVAAFLPLFIALRERGPQDGELYREALDLCVRFAVRTYLIGGYRADAGQTRLYRLAHAVYGGKRDPSTVGKALRRLTSEYAGDAYVREALLETEYNWYRWGALKYFLYEYELHLLNGAKPDLDYAFFAKTKREKTIEHILPQTATSPYWTQRFSKEQLRGLVHTLGNLVLTRDNSAYSNKDFPDKRGAAGPNIPKKPCYAQAPLVQEQELAPLEDWTPQQILARQQRLADWAVQHWAVDFTDLDEGGEPTDEPPSGADEDSLDYEAAELLTAEAVTNDANSAGAAGTP
ncbi:DUF262 domain-containing HNH endonuclease family protein [Dactylosporangium sp. NPDC005572]|uniref:DUF262 domain-containing protein n=1 Tax=Dactylosporangium sp. NPDC005572 TaxID=3156889 RepID=UPI0033A41ADB